ncbi:MAG: hypothetical protein KatS3mg044_0407 [Rhodothermaceae bacterium]|nr:MAG: hypothetical protein KatS3mg044_0407 [Rhodothermaceae bacterium]
MMKAWTFDVGGDDYRGLPRLRPRDGVLWLRLEGEVLDSPPAHVEILLGVHMEREEAYVVVEEPFRWRATVELDGYGHMDRAIEQQARAGLAALSDLVRQIDPWVKSTLKMFYQALHLYLVAPGGGDGLPPARLSRVSLDRNAPLPTLSIDGDTSEALKQKIGDILALGGVAALAARYCVAAQSAIDELVWPGGQPPIEMLRPGRPSLSKEEVIETLRAVREALDRAERDVGMEGVLTTAAEALALSRSGLESRLSEIFRRIGAYYSRRTLSKDLLREVERRFSEKSE